MTEDSLRASYERVCATITSAAERAGRDPGEVRIIAVTKTVPPSRIRRALSLGLRRFGENRVQEALPKIAELQGTGCEWHLIGHLQTNKVKDAVEPFAMIESIDSVRIVEALAARLHRVLDVLIEVNIGEEPQKTGAAPAQAASVVAAIRAVPRLRLKGFMTMAPQAPDPETVRPLFRRLRLLRDELSDHFGMSLPELSMGMTDDYPVAVEEGATMLRLGRALFGPR